MIWIILGAIVCSWAVLRLLGAERQVRLRDLQATHAAEMQATPPAHTP